jgi:capsular polysaccharide biosynthesis protein
MWGTAIFHQMIEVVPRISMFVDFLRTHPNVRIQTVGPPSDRFSELIGMFGLDGKRVVYGTVRAKIVYQPRPTACGFANVQESQLTWKYYRNVVIKNFPDSDRTRNKLILIRRSGSRMFTEQTEIEKLLRSTAAEFGLTFELFIDNPSPSLNDTMQMFHSAVMVVAPHGAGLSNIIFSEPGTFVIEGVCNLPHVNMCFQRLAHVLGHRWHGITSRGGCEQVVDVSATSVQEAARELLTVWKNTAAH